MGSVGPSARGARAKSSSNASESLLCTHHTPATSFVADISNQARPIHGAVFLRLNSPPVKTKAKQRSASQKHIKVEHEITAMPATKHASARPGGCDLRCVTNKTENVNTWPRELHETSPDWRDKKCKLRESCASRLHCLTEGWPDKGSREAKSTGVLCNQKTQCSKTYCKVDRSGRLIAQKPWKS